MTDLNRIERTAANAIIDHWRLPDGDSDLTIDDVADEACAVVAAVRRPITVTVQTNTYQDIALWIEAAGDVKPAEIIDHLRRRIEHLKATS